jgi:alpha-amylase
MELAAVAAECTNVLGPAGYDSVQVAPPQNSLKRTSLGNGSDTVLHPWWEVYQPVTYDLTSRMGNEQQFQAMVQECRKAGVKVYVDAVINHMTGQGNTSYGGVNYTPYKYPDYDPGDFHFNTGESPSSDGGIQDFNNEAQVWNCNLVGLEDLDTDATKVRNTLARYLNKLIRYGVSGFRVDAAKHMSPEDLDAVYAKLNRTADGTRPYWALEVLPGGPGSLSPEAYLDHGNILGVEGSKQLQQAFKSYPANATGSIATLEYFGEESGLPPSDKTLLFVQNHDNERNPNEALSYKDGRTNVLANQFIIAAGYAKPQVYASFEFGADTAQSPPSNAAGLITNTDCGVGWACTHRDRGIVALVGWSNYVGSAPQRNWYDDGANVISFSRGDRGWVAINNGTAAKSITVQTGLPGGQYCDIITGGKSGQACVGTVVSVNRRGIATISVPAKGSVAFDRTDRR